MNSHVTLYGALEGEKNPISETKVARHELEPRTLCYASSELNLIIILEDELLLSIKNYNKQ